MTLDKGLDWDSLLPKNTPSTSIQIEPVTGVIREPIVPSPKVSHKVEHDYTSQLKEPSVRKSTTSKYELPKDLELDLNLAMVPSDNPVSDIEINLLYSQGTQKEENKSSDMKQMMREKGFDIESLLAAENPSQPQQDPEEIDYQKALDELNALDYQDQSMTGLKDKFAGFKDRLNNHLEDNQNLDLAYGLGEMPPLKSPTLRTETASAGTRPKLENKLSNIKKILEEQE